MTLTQEEKTRLLREWEAGGKSPQQFCLENNIKRTTFYGWIKKQKELENGKFVRILPAKSAPIISGQTITIEKAGFRIHLPTGFRRSDLQAIFELIGEALC